MRIDRIEAAIFESLAEELRNCVYVRAYLKAYHEERMRLASRARRDLACLERSALRTRAAFERAHRLYINGVTDVLLQKPRSIACSRRLVLQRRHCLRFAKTRRSSKSTLRP
jgi:hypothetical protein